MIPTGCPPPDPACCNAWWGIADQLGRLVSDALAGCSPECCAQSARFVSHERPVGWFDGVATWLVNARPRSTNERARFAPTMIAQFGVRVSDGGYPGLTNAPGGALGRPSPTAIHAASAHSFSHMEMAVRALTSAMSTNTAPFTSCSTSAITAVTPLPADANHAAWDILLSMELPWRV